MHTSVKIDNSNCTFCVNATRTALLADPLVHEVLVDANAGRWEISHDVRDERAVLSVLQNSVHGWGVDVKGETEMLPIHLGPNDACPLHGSRFMCGLG